MTEKTMPKDVPARLTRSRMSVPDSAIVMMEMTGSATPPIRKPIIEGAKFVPADAPMIGGKMRLPAPKNIEKSVREVAMRTAVPLERPAESSLTVCVTATHLMVWVL